jgi:hypothetical protein
MTVVPTGRGVTEFFIGFLHIDLSESGCGVEIIKFFSVSIASCSKFVIM